MYKVKYVSAKRIIAKVERDLKPNNSDWIEDAKVWIGEAINYIGAYNSKQTVITPLNVIDNKLKLPCRAENVLGLLKDGRRLILNPRIINKYDLTDPAISANYVAHPTEFYNYEDNYFTFTFQTGVVELIHRGIPTDCGYPKIPDNVPYSEAVTFYIINRMLMGGFQHPIFTFDSSWDRFTHFAQKAYNEVDELSLQEMDSFIEEWTSAFCGINYIDRTFGTQTTASHSNNTFNTGGHPLFDLIS